MAAHLKINDDIHWMMEELIGFELPDEILGFSLDMARARCSNGSIDTYGPLTKIVDEDGVISGTANGAQIELTSYESYRPYAWNRYHSLMVEQFMPDLVVKGAGVKLYRLRDDRLRLCLQR